MALNPEQNQIVNTASGKCCVLAGPGSGKTFTLIELIAKLVQKDRVPINRILISTFTKKAGGELIERLQKKLRLKDRDMQDVWIGNFHVLGYRYLKEKGEKARIIDENEAYTAFFHIYKTYAEEQQLEKDEAPEAGDIWDIISWKRAKHCEILDATKYKLGYHLYAAKLEKDLRAKLLFETKINRHATWAKHILSKYRKYKKENLYLDFDDVIYRFLKKIKKDDTFKNKFKWLLLDEAQDQNYVQFRIAEVINAPNCILVGDLRQSIYAFRGSSSELFDARTKDYKNFTLSENYRSSPEIVNFLNDLIDQQPKFKGQTLKYTRLPSNQKPEVIFTNNQVKDIGENILKQIKSGYQPKDIFVLARSVKSQDFQELGLFLRQNKIPYLVKGGFDAFKAKYVQNYLTMLKAAIFKDKLSMLGAFSLFRGVGPKTAETLYQQFERSPKSLFGSKAKFATPDFFTFIETLSSKKEDVQIKKGIDNVYNSYLKRNFDGQELVKKQGYIYRSLAEMLQSYNKLEDAIQDLSFNSEQEQGDRLLISTIHGVKGLEAECVHLANCVEGIIPHWSINTDPKTEIDEFCLMYVSTSRAKTQLKMYFPVRNKERGTENKLSRYLDRMLDREDLIKIVDNTSQSEIEREAGF